MIIAVKAYPHQKQEWLTKPTCHDIEVRWVENDFIDADVYFDLAFEEQGPAFNEIIDRPVFINSVITTLEKLPVNVSRINAWNGFLAKDTVEVVLHNDAAGTILDQLGWKYQEVPDVPGMISIRTIAMIINEAYFALGDGVSSKDDIDIAMKLGTNYPFGPFEWSNTIGLPNIYRLLKLLSVNDKRYQPSPALEQELKAIA